MPFRVGPPYPVIDMSYKTLLDPNKKKMFQKIMAEAKEKTDFERDKENKKRKKLGTRCSLRPGAALAGLLLRPVHGELQEDIRRDRRKEEPLYPTGARRAEEESGGSRAADSQGTVSNIDSRRMGKDTRRADQQVALAHPDGKPSTQRKEGSAPRGLTVRSEARP